MRSSRPRCAQHEQPPRQPFVAGTLICFAAAGLFALAACGGPRPPDDGDPTTPPPAATWSKSLGGAGDDWANVVLPTRDGGFLLGGVFGHEAFPRQEDSVTVDGDAWITKLDAAGDVVWQRTLGERRSASADGLVSYRRVRPADDGGYWLVGSQSRPGASGVATNQDANVDLLVARLETDGAVRWSRTYDSGGFAGGDFFVAGTTARDVGWDVHPARDGGAYAVAWSSADLRVSATSGRPAAGPWVVRLNADGSIRWQTRLVATQFDYLAEHPEELLIRETYAGGAVIAASALLRGTDEDPALQITLLDGGGATRWTKRYSRLRVDHLMQVEEDRDRIANDDIVIAGVDYTAVDRVFDDDDLIVMKLRLSDGGEAWRAVLEEGESFSAVRMLCQPSSVDGTRGCRIAAVGTGRRNATGPVVGMASTITMSGGYSGSTFFEQWLEVADVRLAADDPDASTPANLVGRRSGGTFDALTTPGGFSVIAASDTSLLDATGGARGALAFALDGTLYATSVGNTLRLRAFDAAGTALLDRTYGGEAERRGERIHAAIETADGFLVVGAADGLGTDPAGGAALLAQLDPSGGLRWQRTIDGFAIATPNGNPVEAAAPVDGGGAVLAGVSTQPDGATLVRAALVNASGELLWTSVPLNLRGRFGGASAESNGGIGRAYAASVQRREGGGWYVSGGVTKDAYDDGRDGDAAAWIARIDGNGGIVWQRALDVVGTLTSSRALADGGLVVAGVSDLFDDNGARRPWAARFAADGSLRWIQRYEARPAQSVPVAKIAVAANGGFVLATSHLLAARYEDDPAAATAQAAAGRRNVLVIRLDEEGRASWNRTYGGLQDETLYALAPTADGGFVFAGRSDSLGERGEAWVVRAGPDGGVNAGCNAQLTESGATNYAPWTKAARVFEGVGDGTQMVRGTFVERTVALASGPPSGTELARQCAGFAQDSAAANVARYTLQVARSGAADGDVVTSAPAGVSCGTGVASCSGSFYAATSVTLRIDPAAADRFSGWQGCDASEGLVCVVTMSADRTVTARFGEPALRIEVVGNGTIRGGGLECRAGNAGTCRSTYAPGQSVSLAVEPEATEAFLGWGGDCASFGRARPIAVAMDANRACTATFTGGPPGSPRISVFVEPASLAGVVGTIRSVPEGITCGAAGADCAQTYAWGTGVSLVAEARAPGWQFETFVCAGTAGQAGARRVDLAATQDYDCTARFASDVERLAVKMIGANPEVPRGRVGRVRSEPFDFIRGIDCIDDCDRPLPRGQVVTLRALPQASHVFRGWSGCDAMPADPAGGTLPLCLVTMNAQRNVAAFFVQVGASFFPLVGIGFAIDSADGTVRDPSLPRLGPCTPSGGDCELGYRVGTTSTTLLIEPAPGNSIASVSGCAALVPATASSPAECTVALGVPRGVFVRFSGGNVAPTAVLGRTPGGVVAVGETVDFSALGSSDDQGPAQLSYAWDFDDDGTFEASGDQFTGRIVQFTYTASGTFTARLQVVDGSGLANETTRTVTVGSTGGGTATLTLSFTGGGAGVVTYTPSVTACSRETPGAAVTCARQFANNSNVVLRAFAYGGSTLGAWGPGCSSISASGEECTIFMDGDRTMTLRIN